MKSYKIFSLFVCLVLASCGGGGGGGGGDSKNSAPTGVRILHGSIEASPVDLYSSSLAGTAVQTARFGEQTVYASLPTGEQTLNLTLTMSPASTYFSSEISVEKNNHYSVLLYGNSSGLGLNGTLLDEQAPEIADGNVAVRVAHSLVGASIISASIDGEPIGDSVNFGSASGYITTAAGTRTIRIRRTADARIVATRAFTFEPGKAYTILSSGEVDFLVITRSFED